MRPQASQLRSATIPAPMGGINAVDPGLSVPITDALDLVNMISAQYGPTSRRGYAEWCLGMGGKPVRTVIPFKGTAESGTLDRMFAVTEDGIYDCTATSATPTLVYPFAVPGDDAGWGISTQIVTNGGSFVLYTDEANGYVLYTQATDTWTAVAAGAGAGQINGADPTKFAFVMTWKNRVLFVEKATGSMWFLPVGQIAGTVQRFGFGNKFRAGGTLRGLWSWTIDGGTGIDDHLVVVGGGGDVLVYAGSDPASANAFNLIGSWYVGAVPKGRRIATDYGGDLMVLSLLGVIPMSKLISGSIGPGQYATQKIGSLFNAAAASRGALLGWHLRLHPEDNCLIVNLPLVGGTYEQLALSLGTQAWSRLAGVPILSSEVWQGKLYFGTADGRLCVSTGDVDNVPLSGAATSTPIPWSLLSSFQGLGSVNQKQVQMLKPIFVSQTTLPGWEAGARYDLDMAALSGASLLPGSTTGGIWGTSTWGNGLWGGMTITSGSYYGAAGMGAQVAIALRGSSAARTTLAGFQLAWTEGGLL